MDKLDHVSGTRVEAAHSHPRLARDSDSPAVSRITEIKLLPSKSWTAKGETRSGHDGLFEE